MIDALDAYRRILTSAEEDSQSCWWYLGTTIAEPESFEPVIVNHVETVMIYGARTVSEDSYRVPWWEIGLFRDALTGELPEIWSNPITGAAMKAARQFEEGPSGFSVRRKDGGLEMVDAVQAFAVLDSAEIAIRESGARICITQTEHKTRSFPGPDGRIPNITEGMAVRSKTVLQFLAARADLEGDAASVPASGFYSFELAVPEWLGFGNMPVAFAVRGLMHKTPMQERLNPRGWADLSRLYPHYFDGELIRPPLLSA